MSPSRPPLRLPVQPLIDAALCRRPLDYSEVDAQLGQERGYTLTLARRGDLPAYVADRHAIALGLHPADIWGDAWWAGTVLDPELQEAPA